LRRTGFKSVYTDSGSQPDLDDDFAEQLQSAIDAARDDMERETKQHKADLEATYRKKIEILENQSSRDSSTIARLETELKSTENSLSKAHRDINKLQEQNDQLQNSLMEKEERLFRVTQNHSDELSKVKKDMSQLQASYDEKINDYEELLGLRIQLEQEIKTLSALLQEEEIRCCYTCLLSCLCLLKFVC
jgi:chromosome segregation ATPase